MMVEELQAWKFICNAKTFGLLKTTKCVFLQYLQLCSKPGDLMIYKSLDTRDWLLVLRQN